MHKATARVTRCAGRFRSTRAEKGPAGVCVAYKECEVVPQAARAHERSGSPKWKKGGLYV